MRRGNTLAPIIEPGQLSVGGPEGVDQGLDVTRHIRIGIPGGNRGFSNRGEPTWRRCADYRLAVAAARQAQREWQGQRS